MNENELFCNKIKNSSYDKKHIFLDIDGVIATLRQFYSKRRIEIFDCYYFDKKCVDVLNEIMDKTNANIILSSDWKDHYTLVGLNNIFEINGINTPITDITPGLWGVKYKKLSELEECRAGEILDFVEKNNIKKWVAIDDLDLSKFIEEKNFIHTPRVQEGIKQSGIKEKILKKLL